MAVAVLAPRATKAQLPLAVMTAREIEPERWSKRAELTPPSARRRSTGVKAESAARMGNTPSAAVLTVKLPVGLAGSVLQLAAVFQSWPVSPTQVAWARAAEAPRPEASRRAAASFAEARRRRHEPMARPGLEARNKEGGVFMVEKRKGVWSVRVGRTETGGREPARGDKTGEGQSRYGARGRSVAPVSHDSGGVPTTGGR